jgi:hypothetical protein
MAWSRRAFPSARPDPARSLLNAERDPKGKKLLTVCGTKMSWQIGQRAAGIRKSRRVESPAPRAPPEPPWVCDRLVTRQNFRVVGHQVRAFDYADDMDANRPYPGATP